MFSHIEIVVPPEDEPVTLAEGKAQGRISGEADDALYQQKLIAARERGEVFTRRSFCTQTLDVWYDNPSGVGYFDLPRGHVESITSITLYDPYNTAEVVDSGIYFLSGSHLLLNDWLHSYRTVQGIKIRIVSGYGDPEDVPAAIKEGILAYAVNLYDKRMGEGPEARYQAQAGKSSLPQTVMDLWQPYQIAMV